MKLNENRPLHEDVKSAYIKSNSSFPIIFVFVKKYHPVCIKTFYKSKGKLQ